MNLKRVLLSSIVIFWGCVLFAQQTGPNSDVDVITKGWYEQILANLLKQEYYLHLKKDKHYRAFNRSNNIIGQLKPGAMNLTPKLDSGQTTVPWQAELETVSIVFDNHLVYTPTQTALITSDENTVEFHHGKYTEQYINNEQGLRQNFIIHEGPQSKTIHVNLNLKGLRVNKRHDTELAFYEGTPKGGIQAHTLYKDLKSWDAHGLPLASHFEVMGDQVSIVVSAQNATYPITIDPISTTATTQLESNQANASFGSSVSSAGDVNGDGYSDVIVGANYYDNGQTNEGAAFVYHGSSSGISTTAATQLEGNQATAYFGRSVSSAGDVNGDGYSDVIVGAYKYDAGQTDEGAAFVYHGSSSGISTTAATQLEGNQATAYFGRSVSSAGDVNGDGYSDVIVGANYYDNGQTDEGAAFVYHGSSSGISTTAATQLEANQAYCWYGYSVSSAGDVNGDGYSDVIIGAYKYDDVQTDEGAAFVYHGSSSGISTSATTYLRSNQANAFFGHFVSSAGDVNGDGYSDVIIGAYKYDDVQTDEGAAFVYHGSSSGISTTATTHLQANQADASYGFSVSSAGDVNGDGYSDVIVGAYHYDNGQSSEGAAFVYHGSSSGISTTAATQLESNQAIAYFGRSVSSAGDVNGDGYSDIVVGANSYNNGQTNEGAAFVYHGSASGLSTTASTQLEQNQASAEFGISVASAGDVNGDGYSDVIVGANKYDAGQTDEGAAFVYHGSSSGISTTAATQLEGNQATAYYGFSVSSAGDVNGDGYSDVIVGAWAYDNGQTNEGAAFVYHGSSSGISTTATTQLEGNQATAYFGRSVSSAGDVNGDGYSDVIVGANYYDNGQSNEGAAFLYLGNNGGANNLGVLKDYDDNLSSLYTSSSFADANRGVGLTSKSFLGRQKAKLVYETKAGGNSFSGSPVTTGVTTTGSQASYSDLGTSGTELKTTYAKNNFLRVRLKYDPVTSITGQVYSPWRYMTNYKLSNTPLPVDLTYFEAQPRINHTALLSWSTASEINNSHFEIERSYDGSTFEIVGEVAGNGNSQHLIEYTFKDESISLIQNTVFYRLKQVDFDGTYEYSDIRVVRFDRIGEGMHLIAYPNPFLEEVTLMVSLPQGEDYSLEITDLKGAKVHQSNHTFTSGVHLLNLAKWNKGVYLVEVVSKQGSEHLKVMKK